tara:strand:+ start:1308 stop:1604 length:297 start_codon:yes stop_codon:yes gene_type:complete
MLITLLALSLFTTAHANPVCGIVEHYVPPKSEKQPHKVTLGKIELVFWEKDLDRMEMLPWSLISREVCIEGKIHVNHPFMPSITIRNFDQIKFVNTQD